MRSFPRSAMSRKPGMGRGAGGIDAELVAEGPGERGDGVGVAGPAVRPGGESDFAIEARTAAAPTASAATTARVISRDRRPRGAGSGEGEGSLTIRRPIFPDHGRSNRSRGE